MFTTRFKRSRPHAARFVGVIAVMAVFPASMAVAQGVSATIGVRAQVVTELSIIGTSNLSFGQIVATRSGGMRIVEKNSPDAGRFEVTGVGSEEIQVEFVAPNELVRSTGSGVIGVQLELYGSTSLGNASSAQRLLQGQSVSLSNGRFFFFVGGRLNVGPVEQNPPGNYVGEFELEVSYTNL